VLVLALTADAAVLGGSWLASIRAVAAGFRARARRMYSTAAGRGGPLVFAIGQPAQRPGQFHTAFMLLARDPAVWAASASWHIRKSSCDRSRHREPIDHPCGGHIGRHNVFVALRPAAAIAPQAAPSPGPHPGRGPLSSCWRDSLPTSAQGYDALVVADRAEPMEVLHHMRQSRGWPSSRSGTPESRPRGRTTWSDLRHFWHGFGSAGLAGFSAASHPSARYAQVVALAPEPVRLRRGRGFGPVLSPTHLAVRADARHVRFASCRQPPSALESGRGSPPPLGLAGRGEPGMAAGGHTDLRCLARPEDSHAASHALLLHRWGVRVRADSRVLL